MGILHFTKHVSKYHWLTSLLTQGAQEEKEKAKASAKLRSVSTRGASSLCDYNTVGSFVSTEIVTQLIEP
jgi:hypothetical protein